MLKKFLIGTFVALAFMLVASSASADCSITTTLKVGSKGAEVSCLQTKVGATSDGSFGPMTKASVMAYQASHGLSADGVVGPLSRAVLNGSPAAGNFSAGCSSASGFSSTTGLPCNNLSANTFAPAGCTNASGFSPVTGGACYAVSAGLPAGCSAGALFSSTTGASCTGAVVVTNNGPLQGGAGTIGAVETSTDVNSYMVEGQSDVKVLGFKVQATDSDAKISNVKVTLTHSVAGSSYLDRYVSNVAVWMNGTKIATVSAADFSKDSTGVYSKSIALDNSIVRMGVNNKATFYVTISGISNIDSTDLTAKWNVAVSDFRYQDATGVIMSYNPSTIDNLLTVDTINQTGDVKLVLTADSTSPIAGPVKISDTSSTSDLLMLAFRAKDTGADMTFDSMSFDVTPTTGAAAMIGELVLKANGTPIATWSPLSTNTTISGALQTVAFDLDSTYTLASGSTTLFTVEAKINNIDNFTSGALTVSYNAATVFEVASTRTALTEEGAVAGAIQTFYANGIVATAFTSSAPTVVSNTAGSTTSASYAISFKITASGANYYIAKNDLVASANGSATATFAPLSATGATSETNSWLVTDGSTATFTTTGVIGSAATSWAKIPLLNLGYGTSDGSLGSTYTFSPATSFETSSTYFTD